MLEIYHELLEPLGFKVATPVDPDRRGGHIALTHPDAEQIAVAMRTKINVIPDFRAPNVIRVAMSPLTNTFTEIYEGLRRLAELVSQNQYADISLDENYVR
jgi:kynureninase